MTQDAGTTERIASVRIDEGGLPPTSPEAEQERNIAIFDLLEANAFEPTESDVSGPYDLILQIQDRQLVFDLTPASGDPCSFALPVSGFKRWAREYSEVCDSYFEAVRLKSPEAIERLDEGRRSLHDDGSAYLSERLAGHVLMDQNTARRLFTLLCSLAYRG